jgi:hypothetical protein
MDKALSSNPRTTKTNKQHSGEEASFLKAHTQDKQNQTNRCRHTLRMGSQLTSVPVFFPVFGLKDCYLYITDILNTD